MGMLGLCISRGPVVALGSEALEPLPRRVVPSARNDRLFDLVSDGVLFLAFWML